MLQMAWRRAIRSDEDHVRVVKDVERSRERTMNRAVKLLAAKPRSVGELRERLLEKLWTDSGIVDRVIEKLREYKYLDDEQFARDLAVSKLRQKPQGKRRLQQTMSRKKLDEDVIENAVAQAFETLPEDGLIDVAIAKRLRLKGRPETREDTKKFYDHLLRQGFGFDLIREKMSRVAKGRFEDDGQDETDLPSCE
jgi:regulatory protein